MSKCISTFYLNHLYLIQANKETMDLKYKENGRIYKEKIILDETENTTEYKLAGKDVGKSFLVDHKHVSAHEN